MLFSSFVKVKCTFAIPGAVLFASPPPHRGAATITVGEPPRNSQMSPYWVCDHSQNRRRFHRRSPAPGQSSHASSIPLICVSCLDSVAVVGIGLSIAGTTLPHLWEVRRKTQKKVRLPAVACRFSIRSTFSEAMTARRTTMSSWAQAASIYGFSCLFTMCDRLYVFDLQSMEPGALFAAGCGGGGEMS